MKVVFFGTPDFSVPFLRALAADAEIEVALVVAQPDKPSGRGGKLAPPATVETARELGLDAYQPKSLKTEEAIETLTAVGADAFVVVAYGKLIPKAVLDLPKLGCVNVHPSLLPKYRGPSPMQWTLKNGDAEGGVSVMLLDEGMDTGPILAFERIGVDDNETLSTFSEKVARIGAPLLIATLKRHAKREIEPMPQDDQKATLTKLLEREDGRIDWKTGAVEIERLVRAYEGWPGTWTEWQRNGKALRLKILAVRLTDLKQDFPPGTAQIADGALRVECGDGTLEVVKIQPEGKPPMESADFLRGYSDIAGATLA